MVWYHNTESHAWLGHLQALCCDAIFPGSESRAPRDFILIHPSRQWDHPSGGPGIAASLLRLQWFTWKLPEVTLVEHGTLPWLTAAVLDKHLHHSKLTGCWSRAGPTLQLQSPSSLRPAPAPKTTAPLVAIAQGSTITSIKKYDPGGGHLFYSPLETLQQRCCTQWREAFCFHSTASTSDWGVVQLVQAQKGKAWEKNWKRNKSLLFLKGSFYIEKMVNNVKKWSTEK